MAIICYILFMSMKIDRKAAIKKLKTLVITQKSEIDSFRSKIEEAFDTVFLPNHVERNEHEYGGVKCDVLYPEVYSSRRVILYIHGGSFAGGSRDSYRNFCASLAHSSSSRVVIPEFRLPPTHVFPASIDDLQSVFRMLFAEEKIEMQLEDPSALPQIVIAADSSGASLALALLFKLSEKYIQSVQNVVLLSPWLDFSPDSPLIAGKKVSDEVMTGEALHRASDLYTYAANLENPLVSPLNAPEENYITFPPVYIQMGEKEILLSQAEQLAEILKKNHIECTMDIWPNMMFLFQMADEYLTESHLAVDKLGNYISARDEKDILMKAELAKQHAAN